MVANTFTHFVHTGPDLNLIHNDSEDPSTPTQTQSHLWKSFLKLAVPPLAFYPWFLRLF
jgi:hypothetical protein